MKVRSKDIKKRIGGDFKRKKAKVGRKVERSNVTKISVVAKRITLPVQAALSENKDETARVDGLIRLMQHYSSKNRAAALIELQGVFDHNSNGRRYLGVSLPHVLELLFDGSAEVHRAMLDLLTSLLSRFGPSDFASVAPVLVTYICSGLTSLNLAIRKDTLVILHTICALRPVLIMNFSERIFDHLLTLIESSMVENSAKDSYSSGVDRVANASALVTAKVASVQSAKRKKQESAEKKSAQKKAHSHSVLLLSLKIFVSLLTSFAADRGTVGSADRNNTDSNVANAAQLRGCRRDCLLLSGEMDLLADGGESAKKVRVSAGSGVAAADEDGGTPVGGALSLASPVLLKMCTVLRKIWSGFMPQDPSPLPLKLEVVLRAMVDAVGILAACVGGDPAFALSPIAAELRRTLHGFTAQFPYTVLETSCAETSKKKTKSIHSSVTVEAVSVDIESASESDSEEGSDAEELVSSECVGQEPLARPAVDDLVLRDAKKKFLVLNILISESVMNVYSEALCAKFVNTINRERKEMTNFLKSYQQVLAFVDSELNGVVIQLAASSSSGEVQFDLTPKEYYQRMFHCLRMSFVQSNLVAGFSDQQLNEIRVGAPVGAAGSLAAALSTLLESFVRLGTSFYCKGYIPFVDACVRCVCEVAVETAAQKSMCLGDDSSVTEAAWSKVSAEIVSGLSAALSLMSTFPNEPGPLTDIVAKSAIRFIHAVDSSADASVGAAMNRFQMAVLQVFRPPEMTMDGNDSALYVQAALRTRLRLLDLWAVSAAPDGFISSAEDIFECIRSLIYEGEGVKVAPAGEIDYFLRLFRTRKHDVSLADFKNFVLNSIEAVSYCYNDVILDSVQSFSASAVLSRVSVSEMFKNSFRMIRNYTDGVREILQALTKCSSPEQPCKLLSKLIEPVSGIVSELGATAVEMGNDVSNTSRLFLAVRDVAGIAVIMRELLICCMSGFGWDDASSEAVNVGKSIIELSGRALFAAIKHLQSSARYPGQPGLDDYVTSAAMATPLTPCFLYFHHDARCMDLMAVTVPSVLDISTNGNSPESLAIFNAFLCECEAQWQQLSIDLRLSLLKITKEFYMRNEFEASIITCRNQIELFAIAIKGLESNVDILENIDEIVKFIAS